MKPQVVPVFDDGSDEPQPIFGRHQIIDPLSEDPAAMTKLRDAVNSLRAEVGVGPISEDHLRAVTRIGQPANEEVLETRPVSGIRGRAGERQDIPEARRNSASPDVPF